MYNTRFDLCRLCAKKTSKSHWIDIFKNEGQKKSIYSKITECLPIVPCESDNLPKIICKNCEQKVEHFYNFRTECLRSNEILLAQSSMYKDIITSHQELFSDHFDELPLQCVLQESNEVITVKEVGEVGPQPNYSNAFTDAKQAVSNVFSMRPATVTKARDGKNRLNFKDSPSKKLKTPESKPRKSIPVIRLRGQRRVYVCDICNKETTNKAYLTHHICRHIGVRPFACSMCDLKFYRKFDLHQHMTTTRRHGNKTSGKKYKCDECGRSYCSVTYLKKHKLIHSESVKDRKKFQCQFCNEFFISSYTLNRHSLLHNGEKTYHCDICKKTFNNEASFDIHKLTHSGIEMFNCHNCNESFDQKYELMCHLLTHSEQEEFVCNFCEKSFKTKAALISHKKQHAYFM